MEQSASNRYELTWSRFIKELETNPGSFIVGLLELRYIRSLPVERIINYFESHSFNLNEPTAHKLIERASVLFENLYQCIRQMVLKDPYISADETYYRILVPEKNLNTWIVERTVQMRKSSIQQ